MGDAFWLFAGSFGATLAFVGLLRLTIEDRRRR